MVARCGGLDVIARSLTMHYHDRQSKLSQQELAELQKSTHFDKKELQQWYKGKDYPFFLSFPSYSLGGGEGRIRMCYAKERFLP